MRSSAGVQVSATVAASDPNVQGGSESGSGSEHGSAGVPVDMRNDD